MENTEKSNCNNNIETTNTKESSDNKVDTKSQGTKYIVDTAFFIKLKPIDTSFTYYTTKFVIDEIKDEKAREHYQLNKEFIIVKNPERESMKKVTSFTKKSNDLFNLSITDLSVLALGYELGKGISTIKSSIRSEPKEWTVKKREKKKKKPPE